jgi:hypothetical protein
VCRNRSTLRRYISDFTATSEIRVRDRLREQRSGQLSAANVVSVLDDTLSQVSLVLVCTHGDLAGAIPTSAIVDSKYTKGGWFTIRPVLVVVEYDRDLSGTTRRYCVASRRALNWGTLLIKDQ